MARSARVAYTAGIVLLLALGWLAGRFGSPTEARAVATDRYENFAICTGPVAPDLEAVYFLDFLTGELRGSVMSLQTGRFANFYRHNISADLGIDGAQSPRYLMVTGVSDFRRNASNVRTAASVVYIAELTSGKVAAYTIPWNHERQANAVAPQGPFNFIRLDVAPFREVVVREQ